jgi:hypothetical protein
MIIPAAEVTQIPPLADVRTFKEVNSPQSRSVTDCIFVTEFLCILCVSALKTACIDNYCLRSCHDRIQPAWCLSHT